MKTSLDKCRGYLTAHARLGGKRAVHERPVVTISRETAAGASRIAQLLAERLNQRISKEDCPWTVFDRNLIERVLEDHELPQTIKRFMPEDASIFSAGSMVEELMGLHPSDWTLVHHVTDTMLRLAQMGNVILVGRGANIITAHRKNAFHVRLVAPRDLRIERAAELNNLGAKEAAAFVRKSDRARRRYVKLHFRVAIDEPLLYDATLNTGRFSFETAARLIAEALALQGTP